MKISMKGVTRIVLIFKHYVVKIPNFKYSMLHFLQGCYANWSERDYYKRHIKANYENNMVMYVAPSYFCSWFGLIQIQARAKELKRNLTEQEKEFFYIICAGDNKKENFGYYKERLVCLDYA